MDKPEAIRSRALSSFHSPAGTLALITTAHAVNHGYGTLIALINIAIITEFGVSAGQIGLMVGISSLVAGMAQLVYGFGDGGFKRKVILGVGNIIFGITTALTGTVGGFTGYTAYNVLARLGGSPQHPVGNSLIVEKYPPQTRGSALAMHVSGGNIGTVLVPLLGGLLIAAVGWRISLFIIAIPAILVGLAIMLLIDEPKRERTSVNSVPSRTKIKMILDNRMVMLIMAATMVAAGGRGLGVLQTYIPLYLSTQLGYDNMTTNLLFTLIMVCSVIGPISMGSWADRVGRKPILLGMYAVAAVGTLAVLLLGQTTPLLLVIPLAAVGITAFGESSILQAFLADHTSSVEQDMGFAVFFAVSFGVGSLWAALLGWITDAYGFQATFAIILGTYLATLLIVTATHDVVKVRQAR